MSHLSDEKAGHGRAWVDGLAVQAALEMQRAMEYGGDGTPWNEPRGWAGSGFSVLRAGSDLTASMVLSAPPPMLSTPFHTTLVLLDQSIFPLMNAVLVSDCFRSSRTDEEAIDLAARKFAVRVMTDTGAWPLGWPRHVRFYGRIGDLAEGGVDPVDESQRGGFSDAEVTMAGHAARAAICALACWCSHQPAPARPARLNVRTKRAAVVIREWVLSVPSPLRLSGHRATLLARAAIGVERKPPKIHLVRGHWRLQPSGEGRSDRILVWIEPYARGDGDVASSPAVVAEALPGVKS